MESRRSGEVLGYSEKNMKRIELKDFRTFEYHFPFNYANINVVRDYNCGETHGLESNPINSFWPQEERKAADFIEIEEDLPITKVEVIGSACTPPGYIMLSADPDEDYHRDDEVPGITPVRFRINNLWGMHLRADQWLVKDTTVPRFTPAKGGESYPEIPEGFKQKMPGLKEYKMKMDYREIPMAGMSCAIFSIPRSKRIKILAGSELLGWPDDNFPDDPHYSIRIVRVTVCETVYREA